MCELAFYAINRVWQEVATVPGQPLDGLRGHGVRHIYQHRHRGHQHDSPCQQVRRIQNVIPVCPKPVFRRVSLVVRITTAPLR